MLVDPLNSKDGPSFLGVGESSKLREVASRCLAGLEGGGVKSRGCLSGGDSHMEDSVDEKE